MLRTIPDDDLAWKVSLMEGSSSRVTIGKAVLKQFAKFTLRGLVMSAQVYAILGWQDPSILCWQSAHKIHYQQYETAEDGKHAGRDNHCRERFGATQ